MKNSLLTITLLLSLNFCAQSKYMDGLAYYDKEILANPQNADLYFERAQLKQNHLDFIGAIKDYKTVIKKKSQHAAQANYTMGMLALNYNKFAPVGKPPLTTGYASASSYFVKAIKLQPTYADAYFQAAKCKLQLNKYSQAIQYFSKVIELKPELAPEAYYYRGICKNSSHNKEGACNDFSKAFSLGNIYGRDMLERFCR